LASVDGAALGGININPDCLEPAGGNFDQQGETNIA
jgi:hypothetical protein